MKTLPRNMQMAVLGFVAGFVAMMVAGQGVILALVVGGAIFALFYTGVIKVR